MEDPQVSSESSKGYLQPSVVRKRTFLKVFVRLVDWEEAEKKIEQSTLGTSRFFHHSWDDTFCVVECDEAWTVDDFGIAALCKWGKQLIPLVDVFFADPDGALSLSASIKPIENDKRVIDLPLHCFPQAFVLIPRPMRWITQKVVSVVLADLCAYGYNKFQRPKEERRTVAAKMKEAAIVREKNVQVRSERAQRNALRAVLHAHMMEDQRIVSLSALKQCRPI
jgi:hypothetical protein